MVLHDTNRGWDIIQIFSFTPAYLELRILHFMFGLVELRLEGTAGDSQGSVCHQHHGEFKLCHILTWRKKNVRKWSG